MHFSLRAVCTEFYKKENVLKNILDNLDKKEMELAEGKYSSLARANEKKKRYLALLQEKTYPLAEAISKLSPNELIVFEDALAKYRACRDDKKHLH